MSTNLRSEWARGTLAVLLWAILANTVGAQSTPVTTASGGDGLTRTADFRRATVEAKDLARMQDIDGAERKLTTLNVTETGTMEWHRETAGRLIRVADELVREGARGQGAALANRTLQRLADCVTLAKRCGDKRSEADAKALAGWIHERYRGNIRTALAVYRDAAELAPEDRSVKEALDRLQQAEAMLNARVRAARR
ncbi:MAG: hypothetical protein HZC55_27135 [Verrucomicrobia bacterium]|jgi:hypothetical protein|nr:hypothetical protein [Verrucomicrobiota bacterium]